MEKNPQEFYLLSVELKEKADLAQIYFENNLSYSKEIHSFLKDKGRICKQMESYIKQYNEMNLAEQCTLIRRGIFTRLLQSTKERKEKQSIADISTTLYNIEKWFISRKYGITQQEAVYYYIHSENGSCRHIDTDEVLQQQTNAPQPEETQQTTKQKQFRDYILITEKKLLLRELHNISKDFNGGRDFASLIQACINLGILRKPSYQIIKKEFENLGAKSNYDRCIAEPYNDKITPFEKRLEAFISKITEI